MAFEKEQNGQVDYDIDSLRNGLDLDIQVKIEEFSADIKSRVVEVLNMVIVGKRIKVKLQKAMEEFRSLALDFGIEEPSFPFIFQDLWKVIRGGVVASSNDFVVHNAFVAELYSRVQNLDYATRFVFMKFEQRFAEGISRKGLKDADLCFLADDLWRWLNEELNQNLSV